MFVCFCFRLSPSFFKPCFFSPRQQCLQPVTPGREDELAGTGCMLCPLFGGESQWHVGWKSSKCTGTCSQNRVRLELPPSALQRWKVKIVWVIPRSLLSVLAGRCSFYASFTNDSLVSGQVGFFHSPEFSEEPCLFISPLHSLLSPALSLQVLFLLPTAALNIFWNYIFLSFWIPLF